MRDACLIRATLRSVPSAAPACQPRRSRCRRTRTWRPSARTAGGSSAFWRATRRRVRRCCTSTTGCPWPTTYFTDDLLAARPRERVAPDQCFSPNLKASVVDDLRRRGVLHTEHACACVFLRRYAPVIRDRYGGLVLAFLDVFGGYERGARPLLELSLSLRLLEPSTTGGCLVTFAASDRGDRVRGASAIDARAAVERDVQRRCRDAGYLERLYDSGSGDVPRLSYHTMQIFAWTIVSMP